MSYCVRAIERDDIQCSHARKELAARLHVFRDLRCQRHHEQVLQPLCSHARQLLNPGNRQTLPCCAAALASPFTYIYIYKEIHVLPRTYHILLAVLRVGGKLWLW